MVKGGGGNKGEGKRREEWEVRGGQVCKNEPVVCSISYFLLCSCCGMANKPLVHCSYSKKQCGPADLIFKCWDCCTNPFTDHSQIWHVRVYPWCTLAFQISFEFVYSVALEGGKTQILVRF